MPIAQEKTVGPDTTLQFAGVTLDSMKQETRLPVDKLQKCRMLLRTFYKRHKVTLRELQTLLGLLNSTCSVIVPGRAFLRRMIDLTRGLSARTTAFVLVKKPSPTSPLGLHFWISLTEKHFSWMISGKRRLPLSCLLMQPVLRAMVPSLVSIGFAALGRLRGPL